MAFYPKTFHQYIQTWFFCFICDEWLLIWYFSLPLTPSRSYGCTLKLWCWNCYFRHFVVFLGLFRAAILYFAWCLVCLWRICEQRSIESCKGRNEQEEEAKKKNTTFISLMVFGLEFGISYFLIRLFIYTHSLHLSSAHWAMRWCVAYNICVYICFGT